VKIDGYYKIDNDSSIAVNIKEAIYRFGGVAVTMDLGV
jgi:hypothetical protein